MEVSHKPSMSVSSFILTSYSFVPLAEFKYTERALPLHPPTHKMGISSPTHLVTVIT